MYSTLSAFRHALMMSVAVLTAAGASAARQTFELSGNLLPGETTAKGRLIDGSTDRYFLYSYDVDGSINYNSGNVGGSYGDSCTIYSLPPAGTKLEYWLVSKTNNDIYYDSQSARTSYGTSTYVLNADGTTDNVYIGARFAYISYGISFNGNGSTGGGTGALPGLVYTNSFPLPQNGHVKKGHTFTGWKDPAGRSFAENQRVTGADFGVLDDGTNVVLTAQWTVNSYTLTIGASTGTGSGTVSPSAGGHSYVYGTSVTLTATPAAGSHFVKWSDGVTSASRTVTVEADATLSAEFALNGYTLTVGASTGTGSGTVTPPPGAYACLHGTNVVLTAAPAAGSRFVKWSDGVADAGRTVTVVSNTALSAEFALNSYTLTIGASTGTGSGTVSPSVGAHVYDYGASVRLTATPATGSLFTGWSDGVDATPRTITIVSNATYSARWTLKTYTVELDWQSGSGGSGSVTATYGTPMPAATMPTRDGYAFGGYFSTRGGGGVQYYNADGTSARSWDIDGDRTLYALWAANSYTVTLDAAGGSGGTASVSATYGAAMPTATMPTRTGYTFGGYYTAADGGGMQYYAANGTSARAWDMTAATTLYAKWTANRYRVSLDKAGGSGGSSSVDATYDSAMPSVSIPSRTGYEFAGYFTEAGGGGVQYYDAGGTGMRTWDKAEAATLYASWTAKTYEVTLDDRGGSGGSGSATATYDAALPQVAVPTRTGHTFAGYFTSASGGTKYYNADGTGAKTWDKAQATTLYARWTGNVYEIAFDNLFVLCDWATNSLSNAMLASSANAGAAIVTDVTNGTVRLSSGTVSGNNGWSSTPSATDDSSQYYNLALEVGETYRLSGDVSIVPAANGATPTGNARAAITMFFYPETGARLSEYKTASYSTTATSGSRSIGVDFTVPEGTARCVLRFGTYYGVDSTFSNIRVCRKSPYDSISEPRTRKAYIYADGGTYGELPSPTRTGYDFAGWSTQEEGGSEVTSATVVPAHSAIAYSRWTARQYRVSFDRQGGSNGTASVSATYDAEMPAVAPPMRQGYEFCGYFAEPGGGGAQYYDADGTGVRTWDNAQATTLYAKWTGKVYELAFDNLFVLCDWATNRLSNAIQPASADKGAALETDVTNGTVRLSSGPTATSGYWSSTPNSENSAQHYNLVLEVGETYRLSYDVSFALAASGATPTSSSRASVTVFFYPETGARLSEYKTASCSAAATSGSRSIGVDFTVPEGTARCVLRFGTYYGVDAEFYNIGVCRKSPYDSVSKPQTRMTYIYADGGTYGELPEPTRTGYDFGGWFTQEEGAGSVVTNGTAAPPRSAVVFSKWTANEYEVTLDDQGGSGGTASVSATYGAAMPAATMPTLTGHTFGGYFTEANGGGTQYYTANGASARSWDRTQATTLYAKWTANSYTVTLDAAGGSGGTAYVSATYGSAMPAATMPTRTGYTFGGYFTEANGGGTQYYTAAGEGVSAWNITCDTNLVAKWTANTYTVTFYPGFEPGGGSGEMAPQQFTYDEPQALSANAFVREPVASWYFTGWTNEVSGAFYVDGATVSNLTAEAGGVVALKAVWGDNLSDLSKAMHCYNLNWINTNVTGGEWVPTNSIGIGYNSDSCAIREVSGTCHLAAKVTTSGTLTFYAKLVNGEDGKLRFYQGVNRDDEMGGTGAGDRALSADWQLFEVNVEKPSNEAEWWVKVWGWFRDIDEEDKIEGLPTCICIDRMTWTPGQSPDEPTAADARDITGISLSGDAVSLTFTNADGRFSYRLRGTNDLTAARALWPVLWTTNGTGTITITPQAMPGETKFFYYLETTAK